MTIRKSMETTAELGAWYNHKYTEMGDGWMTPPDESNRHLDDFGVIPNPEHTLLDVGCGAGHFLWEAQKRVHAQGIDISSIGVDMCLQRGVLAAIADVEQPIQGTYDYITSIGSLEHVIDLDK